MLRDVARRRDRRGAGRPARCSSRTRSPSVAAEAIAEERFLVLPHPEVHDYALRKATDIERWLAGMRRLNRRFVGVRRVDRPEVRSASMTETPTDRLAAVAVLRHAARPATTVARGSSGAGRLTRRRSASPSSWRRSTSTRTRRRAGCGSPGPTAIRRRSRPDPTTASRPGRPTGASSPSRPSAARRRRRRRCT